jgi:hypothetical protein
LFILNIYGCPDELVIGWLWFVGCKSKNLKLHKVAFTDAAIVVSHEALYNGGSIMGFQSRDLLWSA